MLERSKVNSERPVNKEQQSVINTESIADMQTEIEKLQAVIVKLNTELAQIKNPAATESLTFKEHLSNFIDGILSPRALLEHIADNIRENLITYLISGLLASALASGIDMIIKTQSLEDIKNVTQTMQAEALKQIEDSIDSQTQELNKRLADIEAANEKLAQEAVLLSKDSSVLEKSAQISQAINKTLETTKQTITEELTPLSNEIQTITPTKNITTGKIVTPSPTQK
ncbi:MAG: hypothetical protein WAX77_11355 [Methylococcaceae bacterium]